MPVPLSEHLEFIKKLNDKIYKEDLDLLGDRLDEQDKYINATDKEVKEMLKEILNLEDGFFDESTRKYEGFFGGLEEWLQDNVDSWQGWGREIALSAYDMFDQIESDFQSTVAEGLKGGFDDIGDFWDTMLNNMYAAFCDFAAELITKWAKLALSGGDGLATSILGKIASYVGEKIGLTGEGGILTAAYDYVASLFAEEGGAAVWSEAAQLPGYGAEGIGGEITSEVAPTATSGLAGAGVGSAWATGGAGFAPGAASITEAGLAGTTGGYTGAGTGVLGGIAGFAAMAIMAAINIEDMRKRRSHLQDLKQQFDDYYATLESSDQAAATFSESQASMFELVGDASTGYFLAQAVSLKASAGEYEELAKIHGETVEAVTARYANLGEAMKDFGYHVDEFGRVATSLGAGELIQEMLWGVETAVSEKDVLKLTLEWDVGNLDEVTKDALKTTNDLKSLTEGPSATMDMDEYYAAAVASAERYIEDMKSKLQDLSTSEQDYVNVMLEVWTDSTNSRTTMSQTFFDSAEESYRALTEVEQAWVLTALSDYESLTTEGTAAAQAFYESQVASYDMLSEAEQAWAQSALGIITEYYDGATALSSSFLEKYRGDYETSISVINEYADNSLSTIQEYLGSLYPELQELYENGTGYVESATSAAEDALNSLVDEAMASAEEITGSVSDIAQGFGTTLEEVTGSLTDSMGLANSTFVTLADNIDAWTPESKVVDILYKYNSSGGDIPGHAAGGVFTSPHLAWIAEAGTPEVVIPLHNGKVPVEWTGGGARLSDGGSNRSAESGNRIDKLIIPIKIVTRDDKELQTETVEITLSELMNRSKNKEIVLYAGGVR